MTNTRTAGHFSALLTILIWGTTFISTKILLADLRPIEILFFRFLIGFFALLIVYPRRFRGTSKKQEAAFLLAGLCGVCLYYLLENIALTYTLASNVGVIISVAPFFTAILNHLFLKDGEKLQFNFFIGFLTAMLGICLISFNGTQLHLNPRGDILALLSAFAWAFYAVLTRKISSFGFHTIQVTRRIFAYGLLCMIPLLPVFGFRWPGQSLLNPSAFFNLLFLGFGASALCFVTWNFAVKLLGAVKTSVYIYLVPVITILTSVVVLHEKITPLSAFGAVLTMAGLFLSEYNARKQL